MHELKITEKTHILQNFLPQATFWSEGINYEGLVKNYKTHNKEKSKILILPKFPL